jgi:Tol biopolymer transport system component
VGVSSLVAIILALLLIANYRSSRESTVVRFQIPSPDKTAFDLPNGQGGIISSNAGAISPDGKKIVFAAKDEAGKVMLWVRALDGIAARPLPGTDNPFLPFWSPDSKSIGFFSSAKLRKIDIEGGPPVVLADAAGARGGTWNRDGVILFASVPGLFRVSAAGGEPSPVIKPQRDVVDPRFPFFLPDGKRFLFVDQAPDNRQIFIGSLESSELHRLAAADSAALYAMPGYLLFVRQGTLLAQPFDSTKLASGGEAVPVAEQVAFDAPAPGFSVSENGTLTYRVGQGASQFQLVWVDRSGKVIESTGMPDVYRSPAISPDGRRIAIYRHEGNGGDVWILEASGSKASRLTFDGSQDNAHPIWTGGGSSIVFLSHRKGKWGIYQKLGNGTGAEELLFESEELKVPMSWSPASNMVLFSLADPKNNNDAWALPLTGDRKPFPVLRTQFAESHPQISPDGKWFAYTSNETGRNEIYVQSFPPGRGKWQVSSSGGQFARWRPDGKELFYMSRPSLGQIVAVSVHASSTTFEFSTPHPLFDSGYVNAAPGPGNYNTYDVTADGQRFLIPRPATDSAVLANTPINVVLNWPALLNKK